MTETRGFRYTWTLDDATSAVVAQRRVRLRDPWFRYPYYLALLAIATWTVIGLARLAADGSMNWGDKLRSAGPIGVAWLVVYLLHPRNLLNRWALHQRVKKIPEAARSPEWGYDDDGLWFRTAMAESKLLWETFTRIVETPECFLFYQGKALGLWLPGKGFPSPEAIPEFARVARDHIADVTSLGDCRWVEQPAPVVAEEAIPVRVEPEGDPIVCRYVWDAPALADAWRWDVRRQASGFIGHARNGTIWFLIAMLVFAETVLLVSTLGNGQGMPRGVMVPLAVLLTIIPGMIALIYLVIIKQTYLLSRARRVFRSVPRGMQFVEWTFEADRVESRTDLVAATMNWAHFNQIVETPTAFQFYTSNGMFHWVPGHGFRSEPEMRRFADMARSRISTYIQLGPCRYVGKPLPIETDEF